MREQEDPEEEADVSLTFSCVRLIFVRIQPRFQSLNVFHRPYFSLLFSMSHRNYHNQSKLKFK